MTDDGSHLGSSELPDDDEDLRESIAGLSQLATGRMSLAAMLTHVAEHAGGRHSGGPRDRPSPGHLI